MDALLYIAAAGVGIGILAGAAWAAVLRRDREQRAVAEREYDDRIQAERVRKKRAQVAALVDRYFPFVKSDWVAATDGTGGHARLLRVLAGLPAVRLGTADIGFDAALPDAVRRQHFLALGKSGYGKTTLSLHLIQDDLERGRGLCILGSEAELFRDWLLPMVPANRAKDVVYFKPSDPNCTLTWNPLSVEDGEDQALAAGEMFAIFKRAIDETSIGPRADAILSSAFGILVGRRGATLWSVIRLLEDPEYRAGMVAEVEDPYLKEFWTRTFPEYPTGAALPLANRLNRFLRMPQVRAAVTHPVSSFSIQRALNESKILLFDLSGLDPDATKLLGQAVLSKFQIELFRRERISEADRTAVHVYVDEFHVFAGAAEGTWRELLSRGRRQGLGLHLFTQHPNQLPRSLQHEIFGNVSSVVALNLSASDATSVRRELLVPNANGITKPVPAEDFVSLPVGEGYARLGAGACALRVKFAPPIPRPDPALGHRVRELSWKTYAAPPMPTRALAAAPPRKKADRAINEEPKLPGRGGQQHTMLQQLARQWGEACGFRATLEEAVLGGAGRVDVALARDDVRVAVEVAVTSSAAEIAATVGKCVASGFDHAVVVGNDERALGRAERTALEVIPAKDRGKVRFVLPDGLKSFLDGLTCSDSPPTTAGYTIRVQTPAPGRLRHRRELARLVGNTLLRRRPAS